ncbi:MAG: putative capsid protein [Circoviridae sp.]|nr:MAG: putative capsid protein [Circoviridae sp.]
MPYKRSRQKKKTYRKINNRFKTKSTNSMYRNSTPRTIQIATRRNKSQVLRFVTNQVYKVEPGGSVGGMECVFLTIRANSIYDIMKYNGNHVAGGTFTSQNPAVYGPNMNPNATGWDEWQPRYSHFTVLGSKITATYQPSGNGTSDMVPTQFFITKSGESAQLSVGNEMAYINSLPYLKKASIIPNQLYDESGYSSQSGVRLTSTYSARKFEGVKDVLDNSQLKGRFNGSQPGETTFFNVGLRNIIPSGAANDRMPDGILTLKVEYIVSLTEPTSSNLVQAPSLLNIFG